MCGIAVDELKIEERVGLEEVRGGERCRDEAESAQGFRGYHRALTMYFSIRVDEFASVVGQMSELASKY